MEQKEQDTAPVGNSLSNGFDLQDGKILKCLSPEDPRIKQSYVKTSNHNTNPSADLQVILANTRSITLNGTTQLIWNEPHKVCRHHASCFYKKV